MSTGIRKAAVPLPAHPGCERFIAKLSATSKLSADDKHALGDMCRNARTVGAKRDIISDGEKPDHVHLVLEGWAARYKILSDGSRQITAFLLPGDFCDLHVTILAQMDLWPDAVPRITPPYSQVNCEGNGISYARLAVGVVCVAVQFAA
jgi:hypothetical protein